MLFVALALLFALVLLVLPRKWSRKVIRIALCRRTAERIEEDDHD